MQKKHVINYWLLVIQTLMTALMITLLASYPAQAQSGRRTSPPPPISNPTPEPTPTPRPAAESNPVKAQYSFRVMSNIPQSLYMDFRTPENMHDWVIDRLKTSKLLAVESGGSANRKEVIEMAKSSNETFMVLLELDENPFANAGSSSGKARQGDIWINYSVYFPQTGKIKNSGKVTLQPEGKTIGVLGRSKQRLCYPNVFGDDYLLLGASLEAAERIMGSFNVPIPPVCQ